MSSPTVSAVHALPTAERVSPAPSGELRAVRGRGPVVGAPLQTNGIYSCFNNGRVVINNYRWTQGAASYGWHRHLPLYRRYVILHEIGHGLGYGHRYHCRPDGLAPTMMQQTKSLYGCTRNAWPHPGAVSSRPPSRAARLPARQ